MKTFGGYLCYEKYYGNEYHLNAIGLNSARNCLRYLIRSKQISKIYVPHMNCDVIVRICEEERINIQYYHIDNRMRPIIDFIPERDEYLYIINFYGQLTEEEIIVLKEQYKNIIIDNAQAFFAKPVAAVDTIYSCRKYFGVPDGAYLFTDREIACKLDRDISYSRLSYLGGSFEYNASDFYDSFLDNEREIDNLKLALMSTFTTNLLRSFDYSRIEKIRKENFEYLFERFSLINKLEVRIPDGPFMYPLYLDNGSDIRIKLIENGVFVPQLWPNVIKRVDEKAIEYDFSSNILPIPCDQRYGFDDMIEISNIIAQYV